jgi:hypothetical protein
MVNFHFKKTIKYMINLNIYLINGFIFLSYDFVDKKF